MYAYPPQSSIEEGSEKGNNPSPFQNLLKILQRLPEMQPLTPPLFSMGPEEALPQPVQSKTDVLNDVLGDHILFQEVQVINGLIKIEGYAGIITYVGIVNIIEELFELFFS